MRAHPGRRHRDAQQLVRTVDNAVDDVLAHAVAAPPAVLRLIRAALPGTERSDCRRELISTFTEATPAERREQKRALLFAAPRTVWTSWAINRERRASAAADRPSDP
jgi:hypothetical protein